MQKRAEGYSGPEAEVLNFLSKPSASSSPLSSAHTLLFTQCYSKSIYSSYTLFLALKLVARKMGSSAAYTPIYTMLQQEHLFLIHLIFGLEIGSQEDELIGCVQIPMNQSKVQWCVPILSEKALTHWQWKTLHFPCIIPNHLPNFIQFESVHSMLPATYLVSCLNLGFGVDERSNCPCFPFIFCFFLISRTWRRFFKFNLLQRFKSFLLVK